jgi:hypothetical protein
VSYIVRGRSAATAATADHAICGFWNPHATTRIKVVSFSLFKQGGAGAAGDSFRMRRTSATGTAGSTVTPGRETHSEYGVAPVSGALLHLAAYSVQPTLVSGDLGIGWTAPNVQGAGIVYPIPGGIVLPPGAGIALVQVAATAWPISEIVFAWLEDWL